MYRFFGHFNSYLYHLISTPESLRQATRSVLRDFADDGLVYLELRTTPRPLPPSADHAGLSATESIDLILSVVDEWNTDPLTSARMVVNLILSVDRAKHTPSQAGEIVDLAISRKSEGVVGIDLAGDPTSSVDLTSFRPAFEKAKAHGLGITLHFAEMPESIQQQGEMEEMLSWSPNRLGHAIHVPIHLREEIVKRGIAVELCLTCNVLAGMLPLKEEGEGERGYGDHHFGWWFASGAGMSLGTDDVGVFLSGLSEEYRLAGEHFGLGEEDLVRLARRAADGAFDKRARGVVDRKVAEMDLI
jgi:adenosine deaminase